MSYMDNQWQFGLGDHCSQARSILGSLVLSIRLSELSLFSIRHLIIDGSFHWLLGKHFTGSSDIFHDENNAIRLPSIENNDFIGMIEFDHHSYVPAERMF